MTVVVACCHGVVFVIVACLFDLLVCRIVSIMKCALLK